MAQITYEDKVAGGGDPTGQCKADDMNEIKSVVNTNDTNNVTENLGFSEVKTKRDFEESAGSWRPIYMKMVDMGFLLNAADKTVAHGISNVSRFVKLDGTFITGSTTATVQHSYNPDNEQVSVYANATNVAVSSSKDRTSDTAVVYIEYTKTTDTPTSQPRN